MCSKTQRDSKMRRQDFRGGGSPPASQGHIQVQNCECRRFNNEGNELLFRLGGFCCFPSNQGLNCFSLITLGTIPCFPGGSVIKNLPAVQEAQVWSLGGEDPLEKEMAAHSSIPAWRMPWAEEPGGLQSKGSRRVRHD